MYFLYYNVHFGFKRSNGKSMKQRDKPTQEEAQPGEWLPSFWVGGTCQIDPIFILKEVNKL